MHNYKVTFVTILLLLIFCSYVFADGVINETDSVPANGTELLYNTNITILGVTTSNDSVCRYSNLSGQSFSSMASFDSTGGDTHRSMIVGFANGQTYNYYIKCNVTESGYITEDYHIWFNVSINS